MRTFAESHLQTEEPNSAPPKTSGHLLKFWVVKTASNISRLEKKPEWWRAFSDYLRREAASVDCDVLFARWADFSPLKIASEMGIVWHLEAREALLFGLSAGGSAALRRHLIHASTIKVGYGVFLLLVWKSEAPPPTRPSVLANLRDFGWRDVATPDYWLGSPAFNATSCATFSMICDPTKNLQNAIAEDKSRN